MLQVIPTASDEDPTNEHYALWEVIEFGDSYQAHPEESGTGSSSESSTKKKGRTVAITTEDMQKRRNDGAILKTFGGNKAIKKTKKNQLKQQYGNFKAEGLETLEQTFNRLQAIVSHLEFMDVEIEQDDLNHKFLTSLAPEWLMYTIVWRNRCDLDTLSLDDVYNHLKVYEPEVQKKSESNSQIWLSFLQPTPVVEKKKTGKKITMQGTDVAGFDKLNVECFNYHKMGHFARECRALRSQDRGRRESYKQVSKEEEPTPKALMAIDGIGWDWSYMANEEENHALVADEEAPTEFALMAKSSSSFENEVKKEKEGLDSKLTGFESASKDLETLLGSQRTNKNKEGLGYSTVPPPPFLLKPTPSIERNTSDLQNSNPFASEHGESSNSIMSKPIIKFVKAADSPTVIKTNKVKTARKPPVKYAKITPIAVNRTNMNVAKPKMRSFVKIAHSTVRRPFQRKSAVRTQSRVPRVSTADLENKGKSVKASACWIWRPKQNTTKKGFPYQGKGSAIPTDPHHIPSPQEQQSPHHDPSSTSHPTATSKIIPTETPTEIPTFRQYSRRATRIAQSKALPTTVDELASLLRDESQGEAFPTVSGLDAGQDKENIIKTSALPHDSTPRVTSLDADEGTQDLDISNLKAKIKLLEDKDKGNAEPTRDDAPIKGRSIEIGEEVRVERSTVSVPPVAGVLTVGVPTASGLVPTVSAIFTTASVVTLYSRRPREISAKDKEMKEEIARDNQRMNEQIARDYEIARIHIEEELKMMIDGMDRINEVIVRNLQEYEQSEAELTIREKIDLINELVKYQDHHAKILKYQAQQSKLLSKKEQSEFYMSILRSHAGWKTKHFRGMTLEKIREKFIPVWKQIKDFMPMASKEEEKSEHNIDFHQIVDFVEASHISLSFSGRTVPLFATMLVTRDEGSGTSTEPHYTPSPQASQSPHHDLSSPSHPTETIPTTSPKEIPTLRQYSRRATWIAQFKALPTVADEPASLLRDESQGEAFPTVSGLDAGRDMGNIIKTSPLPHDSTPRVTSLDADEGTQDLEISSLKARIKLLEDKDKGSVELSGDDAPIKGRSIEIGKEAGVEKRNERGSNDIKELVNVLTSIDAANILTNGVQAISVPSIAGVSTVGVPTVSGLVPTVSAIFTTSMVTPYSRRPREISAKDKGKEKVVESDTPKKKKLQEHIDSQVAKEMEEEIVRDNQRMNEQIVRDAEIARIHAEEELKMMIDGLDRNNEVIARHLQEYEQSKAELTIREKIDLINELEIREKFIPVWKQFEDFLPMASKEEGERVKRKGLKLEQGSAIKIKTSKEVSEEDLKEMLQLVPVEEVYVEALQVKHLIIDWEIHSEGKKDYWKIIRLGGNTAVYQFFVDMLKQFNREDLQQL
nr:hypothetical protein [Tanacetum cinerariifolium]